MTTVYAVKVQYKSPTAFFATREGAETYRDALITEFDTRFGGDAPRVGIIEYPVHP